MKTIIDWGALGPYWREVDRCWLSWGVRPPACNYFTTCPASVAALPIVNGIVRV